MENDLYKMMIANANNHIKNIDTLNPKDEDVSIFQISEVLSLCTGKSKEDITLDIINYNKPLTFQERIKLFYSIWGKTAIYSGTAENPIIDYFDIGFYLNMEIDSEKWKNNGASVSRKQLKQFIDSKFIDYGLLTKEQLIEIMDYQNVPKTTNEILYEQKTKIMLLLNKYPNKYPNEN